MITTIELGSFQLMCAEVFSPICLLWPPLNSTLPLIEQQCKLSTITIGSLVQVQNFGSVLMALISALLVLFVIARTHKKRAAVGRREMNILFCFYLALMIVRGLVDGQFFASATGAAELWSLNWILVYLYVGLVMAVFWILLLNSFVGYQFVEDGKLVSFWGMLLSALGATAFGFILSADIKSGTSALGLQSLHGATTSYQSTLLYWMFLGLPVVAVGVFVLLETMLVCRNLGNQRPLLTLYLALMCFCASVGLQFVLNQIICTNTTAIVNGSVFATITDLAAIVLVFKFWDSITEDDWDNIDDIFV